MSNQIMPFGELASVAGALARSGYFQDAKDEAQAIVKVLAGQEMGLGPFAAMTGIHIIKGKPVLGANIIATLIKNDPRYNYKVIEHTSQVCQIAFFENGQQVGISKMTIDKARKAGSNNLDRYPENMLFARAISNGAKWHTPGIFGGAPVYTPDEFGMDVDDDGDPVILEAEVKPAPPPSAPPPNEEKPRQIPRDWTSEVAELFDNVHAARNGLLLASVEALPDASTPERVMMWAATYRTMRDEGMKPDLAAEHANKAVLAEAAKRAKK